MLHQSKTDSRFTGHTTTEDLEDTGTITEPGTGNGYRMMFRNDYLYDLADIMLKLNRQTGKQNFLVYRNNKYVNITTDNIACFYVKSDTAIIVTFDKQEYFVNYSLEEIQHLLPAGQFFRVNRQYLVNFKAVKEVEHYFARKLLVNLVIQTQDKLLISKEKSAGFLHWLDNR
ncbi:MAG: LytTR family DNA-binding domain-containing protein [Chitinophagaceae bacterium]